TITPTMHLTSRVILEALTAAATIGSLFFYALAAIAFVTYLRTRQEPSAAAPLPPVSVLKPLRGIDPEMYESFRSHCAQDHPDFQLIFGVSDKDDPAIEPVRKLQAEFPARRIDLVICEKILGANVKVSNLAQMLPAAHHEILLVNDADIRVPGDYLRRVV